MNNLKSWFAGGAFLLLIAAAWAACNPRGEVPSSEVLPEPASRSEAGSATLGGAGTETRLAAGLPEALRSLSEVEILGLMGEESGRVLAAHMLLTDYEMVLSSIVAEMQADDSLTEEDRLLLMHYFQSIGRGISGQFDPKYTENARAIIREHVPSESDVEGGAFELLEIIRQESRERLEEKVGPLGR